MDFYVFIAFFIYSSSAEGSDFSYTYYFPPFFAAFLSYFFAPLPPFLFLSSTCYSYLLNTLMA